MIVDEFAAMGTTVEVRCPHPAGPDATRALFADVEAVASRFRPESALSRLNEDPAGRVAAAFVDLVHPDADEAIRSLIGTPS